MIDAAPQPARPARWSPARFLFDVLISIGISAGLSAFVWGLIGMGGPAAAFVVIMTPLLALAPVVAYAPFVGVVIFGLVAMRPGFVLGPALLAGTVYSLSIISHDSFPEQIAVATPKAVAPLRNDHTLVAIESSRSLDSQRIHVLARTAIGVARRVDGRWALERPASGDVCFRPENARRALQFLSAGYVGKCAIVETAATFAEGLHFRSRFVNAKSPAPDLPANFVGWVSELFERIDGRDRLLARRLQGGTGMSAPVFLMAFGKRTEKIDAGPQITEEQLLADAAELSLEESGRRVEPFPFEAVLDAIEHYFDLRQVVDRSRQQSPADIATYHWWTAASEAGRRRALDLRPRVMRLLASNDPPRIAAALASIHAVPAEQRDFADARMFELVLLTQDKDVLVRLQTAWQERSRTGTQAAPISADLRARAASRMDDASLNDRQRQILKMIGG